MVLVEAPIADTANGDNEATTTVAGGAVASAPPVISEAFDQIDELLEDSPQATSAPQRWKHGGTAPKPNRPTQVPARASSGDAPPGIVSGGDSEKPVDSSTEPETAHESAAEAALTASAWGFYAILLGGSLAGLAVAVGLAGLLLSRPAGNDHAKDIAPQPVASMPNPTVQNEEPSRDDAAILGGETDVLPVQPVTVPLADVASAAETHEFEPSVGPVVAQLDEQPVDAEVTIEEPVSELSDEAADSPQVELADDGLASFARWLQSAESTHAPANPTPSAPQPQLDQANERNSSAETSLEQTRPIPPKVNVDARLADQVIAIEFKGVSLANALRTIGSYSTIPITIDPNALGRRNLSAGKQIDLLLRRPAPISDILNQLLRRFRLSYQVVDGHLIVTTPAASKGEFVQIAHEVGDLCNGDPRKAEAFSRWLTQFVEYGSWTEQGGEGQCQVDGTTLTIDHDDLVQYQILVLCERLRVARGGSARSRIKPEFIELTNKSKLLRASQRPVTLRLWRDTSLSSIAAAFEEVADISILIDWQALHLAGWSPKDQLKFFCQDQPLEEALEALLQPLGLTYRILGASTLQITTPEAVASIHDTEFYRLPDGAPYDLLSQQIVQQVGPARFQPVGRGAITYDTQSKTLILSLPQPDHAIVQALLSAGSGAN